jgi:glutamate 5-kinase
MKNSNTRRQLLGNVRRAVIKVGASVLADLPVARVRALAADVAGLREGGIEVVMVTSGAIGMGMSRLDLKRRPRQLPLLQAASSVGQIALMQTYADAMTAHRIPTGQVMLTREDLREPARFLRARHTLMALLDYGVVPIINENDSVAVEEIGESDNDMLAAELPRLVEADLLALLTSAEGIYAAVPGARTARGAAAPGARGGTVVPLVRDIDELAQRLTESSSKQGVRRLLASKLRAAQVCATWGVPTLVASGIRPGVLGNILDDETIGTLLLPSRLRRSRKRWIAEDLQPRGSITVSEEARRALLDGNRSLQAAGVQRSEGAYQPGDAVRLLDGAGGEFARGLVAYSAGELERIKGKEPAEVEKVLGHRNYEEVVRRDDCVPL